MLHTFSRRICNLITNACPVWHFWKYLPIKQTTIAVLQHNVNVNVISVSVQSCCCWCWHVGMYCQKGIPVQMEEAYSELYREFVRLKSICIRQAALLQKLLEELHSKRLVSNGKWLNVCQLYQMLNDEGSLRYSFEKDLKPITAAPIKSKCVYRYLNDSNVFKKSC